MRGPPWLQHEALHRLCLAGTDMSEICPKLLFNPYIAHYGDQNVAIRYQATYGGAHPLAGMADVDVEVKSDPEMRQELDRNWSYMGLMFGHT